ncbi:hypothetical protein NEOLEDRAFT_1073828 [Neolentinus lepideus HHB14362 ss-1]|uniref:Tc1-like transposase DDE domain-containing protein n=1 Tax=Neolentinus lepideus HHB14362 ss-1 TaxID=1314782 RepID=A0A165PLS9_9AGAM|nr:hypothetical protein NEOLEDRAFT_1073828 [Neolentinus lepideus HHB14362 ss-1]
MFLPPYSPDLNPIEEAFAFIKSYLRCHGKAFWSAVEAGGKERPYMFLYEALDQITLDMVKGWISHSGYM